ncbi:MAG: ABC transporter ATP-binding protein [Verrucomicrobiota bacterium]|jgi:putative ABC transport system ATP-binding protein|nr:ABC transporter ATP-binding protein [Verrucomicrobiota bacterium]
MTTPVAAEGAQLCMEGVWKGFRTPSGRRVNVLRGVDFSLASGAFGVITGPSGSGKTTLLMLAGLLQAPDAGRIRLEGQDVSRLDGRALAGCRKNKVGMVFQKFHLLPHRTVLENVGFRFRYLSTSAKEARQLSEAALERVGLADKLRQDARLLSAGEMQRVAIARALAKPPALLLADEPTGNLDAASAEQIISLFRDFNRSGMSILLVTHNPEWIAPDTRHWVMQDGQLKRSDGFPPI